METDGTRSTLGSYDLGDDPYFEGSGRCKVDESGNVACNTVGLSCALEAGGALHCLNRLGDFSGGKVPLDVLVRFTRDAPPRILYGASDSRMRVSNVSFLVTGP